MDAVAAFGHDDNVKACPAHSLSLYWLSYFGSSHVHSHVKNPFLAA
jgi:hypothetical protein